MKRGLKGHINAVLCAFFVILKSTHCSDIYVELGDRLIDYCTDQRAMCEHTGSFIHIVCEYYGKTGSSCVSFREVRLDERNVEEILHRINTMRIHVAKGEAMGQDGQQLPRAYGMRKMIWMKFGTWEEHALRWDISYLSSWIADEVARNKTFSNPLMAYAFANTTSSASAIIDNIFSNWEAAPLITQNEIFQSPDLEEKESKFYIKMIMGNASHVGCAIGVYEHEIGPFATEAFDNIRLSGHLICYISYYSRAGTPVYNTTAPVKGTGWTRCGCPPKYRETKDCLCVATPKTDLKAKQQVKTITTNNLSFPTTSTQAYYDNYEKYMYDMRQIFEATEKQQEEVSETQLLDLQTEHTELESTTPKWTQENLEQETRVGTPTPTCNDQGKCEPKIVMLPVFTIQNAPKSLKRNRGPAYYRRYGNTSLVQSAKATDRLSLSGVKNDVVKLYFNKTPAVCPMGFPMYKNGNIPYKFHFI